VTVLVRTAAVGLLITSAVARADDWPQWRGPHRDGVSRETGLLAAWPAGGPPLAWVSDRLGVGYSGVAVVGDRIYTLGGLGEREHVIALDAATGKPVWTAEVGPLFRNEWGDGPRGTPTVDGPDVFALGAAGGLVCLDRTTGQVRWAVDLKKDFGGRLMKGNFIDVDWGYAEAPLVDGERVVVCPGGRRGTVLALDRRTGKQLWRSAGLTHNGSYSSAVAADIHGVRQYVVFTGGVEKPGGVLVEDAPVVAGVRAADGEVLWRFAPAYRTAAIIPTPLVSGDRVLAVCGYGAGACVYRITDLGGGRFGAERVYATKEVMNYHGGLVLCGGLVYGHCELDGWACADFGTGERKWGKKIRNASGAVVVAGDRLYALADDGKLSLVRLSADAWEPAGALELPRKSAGRTRQPQAMVATHPVVANGRLYVRDQELLYCYDVRARP
jgi:outer membrane protein assembly factor BamB